MPPLPSPSLPFSRGIYGSASEFCFKSVPLQLFDNLISEFTSTIYVDSNLLHSSQIGVLGLAFPIPILVDFGFALPFSIVFTQARGLAERISAFMASRQAILEAAAAPTAMQQPGMEVGGGQEAEPYGPSHPQEPHLHRSYTPIPFGKRCGGAPHEIVMKRQGGCRLTTGSSKTSRL